MPGLSARRMPSLPGRDRRRGRRVTHRNHISRIGCRRAEGMNRALREASLDVVYDGLCRFCERSLAAVQRIARRPLLRLHDANDHERIRTKFPMLADADTGNAMFVVTPRGEVFRGFFAYRRIMWESPRLYPLLPLFYAPGAGLLGPPVYAWAARPRRHLRCSLDGVGPWSGDVPRGG